MFAFNNFMKKSSFVKNNIYRSN